MIRKVVDISMSEYDFYKYENMLKDETIFLRELKKACTESDITHATEILKLSGIVVDALNTKKYENLFTECIDIIEKSIVTPQDEEILNRLKEDKKIFENMYNQITKSREKAFNELVSGNSVFEVNTYLIYLELALQKMGETIKKLSKRENGKEILYPQKEIDTYEVFTEVSNKVFKYFKYKNYPQDKHNRIFKIEDLRMADVHAKLNLLWNDIDFLYENWKFADLSIEFIDEQKIKAEFIDDNFDLHNMISDHRAHLLVAHKQMENVHEHSFRRTFSDDENEKKTHGILRRMVSTDFMDNFFIDSSKAYSKDIALIKWLEAYEIIQDECGKKLDAGPHRLSMNSILLMKKKKEWLSFFSKNGFNRKEAEIIMNQFTFHSRSTDFFDYPFIEFGEYLLLVPSITYNADAGKSISSNFLNERIQLDFRGYAFESNVISWLSEAGITCSSITDRHNKEEFQCDVAFRLDDDIYLVECKAHIQPMKIRQHANHLKKIEDNVKQLDRIARHFSDHENVIKKDLKLSDDFSIKNIHKIVLTTSMMGSNQKHGETFVVDASSFSSMILRKEPSKKMINKKEVMEFLPEKFECYQGKITSEKMLMYLENPPQIQLVRKMFKKVETNFYIGQVNKFMLQEPVLRFAKEEMTLDEKLEMLMK